MAQTFKDFVAECATYNHSKEHYEMMKECSEIALMEQYISDQVFLAENVAELTTASFTESYFIESAEADQVAAITEAVAAKKEGLWKKIAAGLKRMWDKFVKFLQKWTTKMISQNVENQKVLAKLNEKELTKKEAAAIQKAIVEAMNSGEKNAILPHSSIQPFAKKIALKGQADEINVNALAVAFSNETAVLVASNGAVSASAIVSIVKGFTKGKKGYEMEATCKKLDAAIKVANSNGVEIWANDKKAQKLVDTMTEFNKQLVEKEAELDEETVENIDAVRDCYGKLIQSVGSTITLYNAYLAYRTKVVTAVKTVVGETK